MRQSDDEQFANPLGEPSTPVVGWADTPAGHAADEWPDSSTYMRTTDVAPRGMNGAAPVAGPSPSPSPTQAGQANGRKKPSVHANVVSHDELLVQTAHGGEAKREVRSKQMGGEKT